MEGNMEEYGEDWEACFETEMTATVKLGDSRRIPCAQENGR